MPAHCANKNLHIGPAFDLIQYLYCTNISYFLDEHVDLT
jgi:hypothetical protein